MPLRRFAAAVLATALSASLFVSSASAQAALPFRAYGSGLIAGQTVEAFDGTRSVGKVAADGSGDWVLDILPETAQVGDVITFTRDGQPTTASIVFASGQFTPPPGLTLSIGSAAVTPPPANATLSAYTIQAGDTLYALALKWNTTSDAIASLNGITDPSALQIGQVLKVPGGAAVSGSASASAGGTPSTYTIVGGDNLSTLATKWGTTVDAIASLNGINDPTLLRIGQVLKMPGVSSAPAAASGSPSTGGSGTYTVVTGDNLSTLASTWGTTVDAITSLNGITDPGSLQVGQVLKKP
jgi:LysM repeat protein